MIVTPQNLADRIARITNSDGIHVTEVPRVHLIRSSRPTRQIHTLHEPALCLVVQGSKSVMFGDQIFEYDQSRFLIVSFDLPLIGQVVTASRDHPYLCFRLDIEPASLCGLIADMDWQDDSIPETGSGLMFGNATQGILDAAGRLVRLIETPEDIPVLAPVFERELLYRILRGPHAHHLRDVAIGRGRGRQIARALSWIKKNYRTGFHMEQLAAVAGLSTSALHHHFKLVTLMTPLQYQKQLRLQEACRLMMFDGEDAASAGFAVGYDSPSHFSREYRRAFGDPPLRHVAKMLETEDFPALI